MKRRAFITLVGGAAAWPMVARGQQPERMRRIGVLMTTSASDPEGQARIAAFLQGLQQLGWIEGRSAQIDIRWSEGDADRVRKYATELIAPRAGRHLGSWQCDGGAIASGDPHHTDRVRACSGSGWRRHRQQLGAAGRQRHRFYYVRIRHEREMAGTAQRDRAGRDTSRDHSGFRHNRGDRPVGLNPVDSAVARPRGNPGQHA